MNKVGIYFAYWSNKWSGDYHNYIDKVSDLDFDVLELCSDSLIGMPDEELISIKNHAKNRNLELTFCAGFSPENDPSSLDEKVRNNGLVYAKNTLKAINKLEGKIFGGINYAAWPVIFGKNPPDKKSHLAASLKSMDEIKRYAEYYGVTYCVEVVNRFEQFLINTAQEAVDFINMINSPNIKILLDTFHMNIEEDSIYKAIRLADKNLGHMHIGENNRKTPGKGHLDWDMIMKALKDIDYNGHLVMEPFVSVGGDVGRDIKVWRNLENKTDEKSLDLNAREALNFIRMKNWESI